MVNERCLYIMLSSSWNPLSILKRNLQMSPDLLLLMLSRIPIESADASALRARRILRMAMMNETPNTRGPLMRGDFNRALAVEIVVVWVVDQQPPAAIHKKKSAKIASNNLPKQTTGFKGITQLFPLIRNSSNPRQDILRLFNPAFIQDSSRIK